MALVLVEQFLWLLLATVTVALVAHRVGVPDTVALLAVGAAVGFLNLAPMPELSSETILAAFLPALLFQAAIRLDLQTLRETVTPIATLAIVGVGISIAIIAGAFWLLAGLSLASAAILASLLSATDPVAVLAIFGKLNVPRRLAMIVEGESLFNDGTALVAFNIALVSSGSGGASTVLVGLRDFAIVVSGGLIAGVAAGWLISHIMALTSDHLIEMGLSTVAAYGSYLLGAALHVSPVITVLAAGLVIGNYGRRVGMSERAQTLIVDLWDYLAFVVNSFVFLLVGVAVRQASFGAYVRPAALAIVAVLVSRGVVVYALTPLVSRFQLHIPFKWRHLIYWGGLRGGLTVAMALSLPTTLPEHDLMLAATFAVVVFTVMIQGLTTQPLVKALRVGEASL